MNRLGRRRARAMAVAVVARRPGQRRLPQLRCSRLRPRRTAPCDGGGEGGQRRTRAPRYPWVTVRSGSSVEWRDATSTPISLVPAPVSVPFSSRLSLRPGARAAIEFASPGIYVYALAPWTTWTVSDDSHTSVQGPLGLPRPHKSAPGYPEPGFGAVAVIGADPHAPAHKDVALPWNYYDPAYTVIHRGGSITWQSLSKRAMTATSAPGAPVPFNVAVPPHASVSHRFTRSGMYVYYSRTYASWDPKTSLPVPAHSADIYPIAQVGIVVVEPLDILHPT